MGFSRQGVGLGVKQGLWGLPRDISTHRAPLLFLGAPPAPLPLGPQAALSSPAWLGLSLRSSVDFLTKHLGRKRR